VLDLDGATNGVISTVAGLATMVMPAAVPWLAAADPHTGYRWLMLCTLAAAVMQLVCLIWLLLSVRWVRGQQRSWAAEGDVAGENEGLWMGQPA
jgi:hypothetical protein